MNDLDNEQLRSRLERAEASLKGLRFSIPALAVLACVAILMHLDKPTAIGAKSVIAETFSVGNAQGNIVAQFGAGGDGFPSIAFFDANKKVRLIASIGASGPTVSLFDPQQVSRATLSLNDKSDPSLTLFNGNRVQRGVFAIDQGDSGHLILYGTAGGLDLTAHDGRIRWSPLAGAPVDALPVAK